MAAVSALMIALVAALCGSALAEAQAPAGGAQAAAGTVTVIHCGHFVDVVNGKVLSTVTVTIEGKRIRDVEEGPDGTLWMIEDANPGALIHVTPK